MMATKSTETEPKPQSEAEHMLTLGEILSEHPAINAKSNQDSEGSLGKSPYRRALTRGMLAGLLLGSAIIIVLLIVGR